MMSSSSTSRGCRSSEASDTDAEQPVGWVDDVDFVEGLGQVLAAPAGVVDRLADAPEFRHRHEFRLHQTAGGVLFIGEAALEFGPVNGRQVFEDSLAPVVLEILEDGGRIIGIEFVQRLRHSPVGQHLDGALAVGVAQLDQDFGRPARRPAALSPSSNVVIGKRFERIGGVRRVHPPFSVRASQRDVALGRRHRR
jgi:hypothetical protein